MTALFLVAALLLLAIAAAAIAWPLLREPDEDAEAGSLQEATVAADPLDDLLARRDAIYQAIRELRFDYQVGKVSEADYHIFEDQFKIQAVAVLKEIDQLQAAEADGDLDGRLEAEIAALRRNGHGAGPARVKQPAGAARFCSQCGQPVQPGDLFCGACGAVVS